MKKMTASLLFTFAFSAACFAETAAPAPAAAATPAPAQVVAQPQAAKTETAPAAAQPAKEIAAQTNAVPAAKPAAQANCQTLPTDQQDFATKLSAANKATFCNTFSMDQRKAAMQMTKSGNAKVSADQAVQQIASNNAAPAPAQAAPAAPQKPGACPVRQ